MKFKYFFSLLFSVFMLANLQSQETYKLNQVAMTIEGTSNLHDWESKVNDASIQGKITTENGIVQLVGQIKVSVPVTNIESPRGNIMDRKTYNALKYKEHPKITFEQTGKSTLNQKGNTCTISLNGKLTIAGKTRTENIQATATILSDKTLRIKGSKKLKMSDFDVETPSAMFGTVTTGDDVIIHFTATLKPGTS